MCWHYYNPAVTAEKEKAALEEEKASLETEKTNLETELEDIMEEVDECEDVHGELIKLAETIRAYESTYRQLGAAMEDVIVNGKAYDEGRCYEIADQIKSISDEFTEYTSDISFRIENIYERRSDIDISIGKIDDELETIAGKIPGLNTIISRKNWTCASCRALSAKKTGVDGPVMEMM